MKQSVDHLNLTGNQAVASIAYKINELCVLYPITPATEMGELVEEWSALSNPNIFGNVPATFEMQSEIGVAGAMHGALQTGTLATTFTASQGLLLMLPNMNKIAGELSPNVIHVATRSIATHALSIYGDHSDIMAVRNTGYAMLGAASVQEAQDFALISQVTSLKSRIPFIHFFDGFRTSHEIATIETLNDQVIEKMISQKNIQEHRNRALNPNSPVIRGTAQGPDTFFQARETTNSIYNACPDLVQKTMDEFGKLTGRKYKIFEYVGDPNAEQVIVSMASSTESIEKTIKHLNAKGEKIGLIKVRLYRPFSSYHLLKALPKTCRSITVLDRTKEPGATGEPLYLDVVESILSAQNSNWLNKIPTVVGGRYGLSSKELSPNMIEAIITNSKKDIPMNGFTIGINDDVTNLSLDYSEGLSFEEDCYEAVFYESKSDRSAMSFKNTLDLIQINTENKSQGFTECDYNKSNPKNISHLRYGKNDIKAPYLIMSANFIACDDIRFLENTKLVDQLKEEGILLVSSKIDKNQVWDRLPADVQTSILKKKISLHVVDPNNLRDEYIVRDKKISGLQACFFVLNQELIHTYMLYKVCLHVHKIEPKGVTAFSHEHAEEIGNAFDHSFAKVLLEGKGNEIPVSAFPIDGTFATGTSEIDNGIVSSKLPVWDPELCTQCGACSMACPQAAIQAKVYPNLNLVKAPSTFKSVETIESDWEIDLLNYTLQLNPTQCSSCNHCIDACDLKALKFDDNSETIQKETENWKFFESLPKLERTEIDFNKVSQLQVSEPLFKYPKGVKGCGEAPYLKLVSQLFGDRMIVANATGSSSILGGALPTTPWSKNDEGRGPAWSSSLFEDNAEFGLGFRLSLDQQKEQALTLLKKLTGDIDFDLIYDLVNSNQDSEANIELQRLRVDKLRNILVNNAKPEAKRLNEIADSLVETSVWIIGGDGWAYDSGYGGLDHVLASGKNVNILVLDNEVYDNTGGQMSKATPFGAATGYASNGKQKKKKDLGLIAMHYKDVYVASVAIGANQEQTLKAFNEAEKYEGPSLIIAYCHSDTHGIDTSKPSKHHKAAVDSGQWLLYRNDPNRIQSAKQPFQLDSELPKISIEEYLSLEKRFDTILESPFSNSQIAQFQENVDARFEYFLEKSLKPPHSQLKNIVNQL